MRCKCCDRIMQGEDWEYNQHLKDFDDLCFKCRSLAYDTITVINDVDFGLRTTFERWMNAINKHDDASGLINPAQYQRNAIVKQYGRASTSSAGSDVTNPTVTGPGDAIPVLKAYKFYGVFPTSVSAIDLSYDSTDTIEEFTVDLQVQWWDALDSSGVTQLNTDEEVLNPQ